MMAHHYMGGGVIAKGSGRYARTMVARFVRGGKVGKIRARCVVGALLWCARPPILPGFLCTPTQTTHAPSAY